MNRLQRGEPVAAAVKTMRRQVLAYLRVSS